MFVENIVIGKPLVEPKTLLALDDNDWETVEQEKTLFTDERFLPRILVQVGIYPSVSEILRNRPDLMLTLDKLDFIDKLKVAKKKWVWIVVGE